MISGRALHYVFKIVDRSSATKFYGEVLGMKVLRHEEFDEECEAQCNGPYDNLWSKTMMGYGPEDTHFAVELTCNYIKDSYVLGNDFQGITIKSSEILERARKSLWPIFNDGDISCLTAPEGYKFFVLDEPQPRDKDPIQKVSLASSDLKRSIDYWGGLLGMEIVEQTKKSVQLQFAPDQANLELIDIGGPVNHAETNGRIAFSCPFHQQPIIDMKIQVAKQTVITPMITLPTPGKASVRVIILADPDMHEICFVDDESYRQLSQVDVNSAAELARYAEFDKERKEKEAAKQSRKVQELIDQQEKSDSI